MRIIINADDLGLTHEANLGIAEAHARGMFTQATLVVNSEFTDEGVALAHDLGIEDRVGLHLNLSECEPLSQAIRKLPAYVGEDGRLCYTPRFMTDEHRGESPFVYLAERRLEQDFAEEVAAVREEVAAQVARFRELGFSCRHLDSHLSTHFDMVVWLAARPVLEEAGFCTMRPTHDSFKTDDLYNRLYNEWLDAERAAAGLFSADYVSSAPRLMWRRHQLPPDALVEIYVHPILVNGRLEDNFANGALLEDTIRCADGLPRTSYYELVG